MRFLVIVPTLAILIVAPATATAGDLTAQQIIERATEANKLDGAEMVASLVIYNAKKQKRERTIATVSKLFDNGDTEKRLIRFVAPADVKGTGLLTYDYENENDDMWLFMPALRKTRRIVSSDKAKNFMGSEFTYADITPPSVSDFNYKKKADAQAGGVDCYVVESTPKTENIAEENGYSKRIMYVAKKDFVIRRSIYYDLSDELLKELTASKIKEVDTKKHRYRPMLIRVENKQNGRSSEMNIKQIQLRADIPDDYFTTRYLERQ